MPFYSFKVQSKDEVIIPSRALAIGEGIDVFNKVIDDLPEFLGELQCLDVRVIEYHRLDSLEPLPPEQVNQVTATFGGRPIYGLTLPSDSEQHSPETEE
jgi:hypothetical protein